MSDTGEMMRISFTENTKAVEMSPYSTNNAKLGLKETSEPEP